MTEQQKQFAQDQIGKTVVDPHTGQPSVVVAWAPPDKKGLRLLLASGSTIRVQLPAGGLHNAPR